MRKKWWKIACVILLIYTVVGGFLINVPALRQLQETIRNLYFHVCMWLAMMTLFAVSVIYSIRYLRTTNYLYDLNALVFARVGVLFGILGYATGAVWASYTWADPNNPGYASFGSILREPKLIGAAMALLIYFAYFVLRSSVPDIDKRARVGAVYNIFAFAMLFPSIWIVPRLLPSLHPGGEQGNPGLDFRDLDNRMRMVYYPAVIGWTLLGVWIATLELRFKKIQDKNLLHA